MKGWPAGGRRGSSRQAALFALAAASTLTVAARSEPVYVIEQVLVSVASSPGGDRVATVKSGERLELLEREQDAAHVRLANGTQGWVKASYLTSEPPLQQRLSERTLEVDKLKQEVAQLQAELSGVQAKLTTTGVADSAVPPAVAPVVKSTDPDPPRYVSWQWALGGGALMLLLGFLLGWRVLDGRIRRKYGGLRIY